jgi:hypothetical protein
MCIFEILKTKLLRSIVLRKLSSQLGCLRASVSINSLPMQEIRFTILYAHINEQPISSCSSNPALSSVDTESEGLVVMTTPVCPKENLNFELILAICVSNLQKKFADSFTDGTNQRVQTASITSSYSHHAHPPESFPCFGRCGAQGAKLHAAAAAATLPPKIQTWYPQWTSGLTVRGSEPSPDSRARVTVVEPNNGSY